MHWQLFHTFFKTLQGKEVTVELKNNVQIRGTLHSVDQYLNFKLENTSIVDPARFPQLVRDCHDVCCIHEPHVVMLCTDYDEERLYSRLGGPLRAFTGGRGRHRVVTRRRAQGSTRSDGRPRQGSIRSIRIICIRSGFGIGLDGCRMSVHPPSPLFANPYSRALDSLTRRHLTHSHSAEAGGARHRDGVADIIETRHKQHQPLEP